MSTTNKTDSTENNKLHWFETFSSKATKVTGSSGAFITACILIIVWIVTGPVFHYSDVWQLAINTSTTIVTFLMVFLIQKTQNKDALAIQVKLNELVAANQMASNRIVSVEDLSEEELERLNDYYTKLAEITKREKNPKTSRSIEDTTIEKNHIIKKIDDIGK
ncbi:MAG TPA: low affinity iron permease family protein [Bacteroidia bacterium]|nr:low affinity iron permease family protein [Bacteroidia bacterium]